MEIKVPFLQNLFLTLSDNSDHASGYPTNRLKKGVLISRGGVDLAEEAVGFGLPVLKRGLQTYFPGDVELALLRSGSPWCFTALYTINKVERIAKAGSTTVNNPFLYAAKNGLAGVIRALPPVRKPLTTASNKLRAWFGWETTFEKSEFSDRVGVTFTFDESTGLLSIEADLSAISPGSITEIIMMNEQGGNAFDQYRDSSGNILSDNEIGSWDEVRAEEATFACLPHRVTYSLAQVAGARLYRGREVIGSRLAWSGFGYSLPPGASGFSYTVKIGPLS